jgi:transposase
MRDDDGRKLDHKTLEQLRIRAVRQVEQGAHPEEVAAALGMTRAAVYGWLANYREGGLEALKARPVPGRPPTLSGAQLQRVYTWSWAMTPASCSSPLPCGPAPWCGS